MNRAILRPSFTISESNSKYYLVLFILWPFLAFLTALANYSQKEPKKVVYFFLIYYGLIFVISEGVYIDAVGYANALKHNSLLPFSEFFNIVGGLYTDTTLDIISPFISFIVSRFTDHHGILYAIYAAIYGFFYLKSVNFLYNSYRKNPEWNAMIHLAFFIMVLPITAVSGVRMPIAIWVFFYGAYHVILYRDAKYLLLTLASSLMHWSLLSANVVLIIYFFVGNRNLIYFPIVFLSFILPKLMTSVFQSIALKLGGPIQARYEGYTNENYVLGIQESYERVSWFVTLSKDLVFYYFLLVIIVIQVRSRILPKEKVESNLFSFLLLFLAFVNFGKVIPSFGNRFQFVFLLFAALYVFMYYLKIPGNKVNLLTWIGLFPMILNVAVTFRIGSETINAWIFSPGLGLPLLAPGLSIAELLFH